MIPYEKKEHYTIDDLAEIVTLLRSKDGCPWDKVQTHESIRPDLIEETYEVIEAIDQNDPEMLREELGDLLLQVVFHSRIETEQGHFTLDDVCTDICNKLIIRHPHVFSTVQADTTEEVLKNWDTIKDGTKHQTTRTRIMQAHAGISHAHGRCGSDHAGIGRTAVLLCRHGSDTGAFGGTGTHRHHQPVH